MRKEVEDKLISFSKTENWRIVKQILKEIADRYYSWDLPNEKLPEGKGVQNYLKIVIGIIEGGEDAQTFEK